MNVRRLQHLVNILRKVKPEEFEISHWKCGTTACAFGHACLDKHFKEEGLGLEGGQRLTHPGSTFHFPILYPTFEGLAGMDAAAAFFGISDADTDWLFDGDSYYGDDEDDDGDNVVTANDVAVRVEQLLRDAGKA